MKMVDQPRKLDPHALAEAALMADIGVLIALLRFYVPIVGAALHFVEPLPIILLVIRHGARAGLMATIVGFILTSLLAGPSAALWLLRLCANGIVLGYGMRRGWSAIKTIWVNVVAMWLLGIVFLALALWIFGIGPDDVRKDTTEFWQWFRDTSGWLLSFIGLNGWWQEFVPGVDPLIRWLIQNWLVVALSVSGLYYLANSLGFYAMAEPLLLRIGIRIPHLRFLVPTMQREHEVQT